MEEGEEQLQLFKFRKRRFGLIEVEIYHDEVYDNKKEKLPFGHQFLIVPIYSRSFFNNILMNERKKVNAEYPSVRWHELKKESKSRNFTAKRWLEILYGATYNKQFGYIRNREIKFTKYPLGIKILSIFIDSLDELSNSYWKDTLTPSDKRIKKYEALLRMGIQGIVHYCFNPEYTNYSKIIITRICTDGKYGSIPIDSERIIRKLEYNTRSYIGIKTRKIECIPKSKDKTPEVNFEELTDLVLGSSRYLCGYKKRQEWKDKIVKPLKIIYDKRKRNKKGRESSPHYRSFSISHCSGNEDGLLHFDNYYGLKNNMEIENELNNFQLRLGI